MDSRGRKANILDRDFREIGIGVATGTYRGTEGVSMYTVDFGTRRQGGGRTGTPYPHHQQTLRPSSPSRTDERLAHEGVGELLLASQLRVVGDGEPGAGIQDDALHAHRMTQEEGDQFPCG